MGAVHFLESPPTFQLWFLISIVLRLAVHVHHIPNYDRNRLCFVELKHLGFLLISQVGYTKSAFSITKFLSIIREIGDKIEPQGKTTMQESHLTLRLMVALPFSMLVL